MSKKKADAILEASTPKTEQPPKTEATTTTTTEDTEKKPFARVLRDAMTAVNDDGSRDSTSAVKKWLTDHHPEHNETTNSTSFNSQLSLARKKMRDPNAPAPVRKSQVLAHTTTGAAGWSAGGISLETAKAVKEYNHKHKGEALSAALELIKTHGVSGVSDTLEFIRLLSE